jgi:hypothetical protein
MRILVAPEHIQLDTNMSRLSLLAVSKNILYMKTNTLLISTQINSRYLIIGAPSMFEAEAGSTLATVPVRPLAVAVHEVPQPKFGGQHPPPSFCAQLNQPV